MTSEQKNGNQIPSAEKRDSFITSFEKGSTVEEKVVICLDWMKKYVSSAERDALRNFWTIKKILNPLFKEKMDPVQKNQFWNESVGLREIARQLKEIKDEEANFAIKELTLAIEELEKEVMRFDDLILQAPSLFFPKRLNHLLLDEKRYTAIQKKLWALKIVIARLESLRKELIRIDMRMGEKNKLLKRLSQLGDIAFPRRKALIEEVTQSFLSAVNSFVDNRLLKEKQPIQSPTVYYRVREEIKGFQSFAKSLTLTPQGFSQTYERLGQFWNTVLEKEKELRKEEEKKFENGRESSEAFLKKIDAFESFCSEPNQTRSEILERSKALHHEIKALSLSHGQIKTLRDKVEKIESSALKVVEGNKQMAERAIQAQRDDLQEKLDRLLQSQEEMSLEELEKGEFDLREGFQKGCFYEMNAQLFERQLTHLKMLILDKKEKTAPPEALHSLCKEQAAYIRFVQKQVDAYKKQMNRSNLDFERAMLYQELYEGGKKDLDRALQVLDHIEEKLP